MEQALRALNRLVEQSLIRDYALGGAIAASFYIDALNTEDVDAFIVLPEISSGLVSLTAIYAALEELGGVIEGEHVRFGAWPLQVLTDANPLLEEAIHQAISLEFGGVPVRVFRAEHLCAVALQTGRKKDILRVGMFLDQNKVEEKSLQKVAKRYGLLAALERLSHEHQQGKD